MNNAQPDHPNINRNIHPPLVTLFYIVIACLAGWFIRVPWTLPDALQYVGFGMVIVGFLLAAGAFVEFRKAHTTLDPHGSVKQLVTEGVYRFTRNPIYLGFLVIVIGLPLNMGSVWGFVAAPLFVLTMNRLVIEKEEAYLEKKFGDGYTRYKSRVRRWL
jgi:protein-S-isoprenylcysteine O-methyltransferase Ste14